MRPRIIKIVFLKELREMLRDRRSLAILFGIPLVLYPLLTVVIGTVGMSKKKELTEKPARVAIANAESAPRLMEMLRGKESGVEIVSSPIPQADLSADKLDAVLEIPRDAETLALDGRDVEIAIKLDRSRTSSLFVEGKITKVLNNYDRW